MSDGENIEVVAPVESRSSIDVFLGWYQQCGDPEGSLEKVPVCSFHVDWINPDGSGRIEREEDLFVLSHVDLKPVKKLTLDDAYMPALPDRVDDVARKALCDGFSTSDADASAS